MPTTADYVTRYGTPPTRAPRAATRLVHVVTADGTTTTSCRSRCDPVESTSERTPLTKEHDMTTIPPANLAEIAGLQAMQKASQAAAQAFGDAYVASGCTDRHAAICALALDADGAELGEMIVALATTTGEPA